MESDFQSQPECDARSDYCVSSESEHGASIILSCEATLERCAGAVIGRES
jgi:hypothetical protein